MKVTERDKYLLIGLSGILFFVIAWFLVATPIRDKTENIRNDNVDLKATAELYQAINARADEYAAAIGTLSEKCDALLAYYPVNITKEDEIMFWANTENKFKDEIAVSTLTMSDWQEVMAAGNIAEDGSINSGAAMDIASAEAATDGADETAQSTETQTTDAASQVNPSSDIKLYRAPINYGYTATYRGIKDMLTYFYKEGNRKSVDNISIAYDSATGNLNGSIDLSLYYMIGADREYQPVSIPGVPKGVSDVFHTVQGAGLKEQIENETDTTDEAAVEE